MVPNKSRRVLTSAKYWQGTIQGNVKCGHSLILLLLLPSLSSLFHSCAAQKAQKTSSYDIQGLRIFKKFADPDGKKLTSWSKSTDPCTSTIKWLGIVCNQSRVSSIMLNGTGLSGTFANGTLGKLTKLTILDLSHNNFTGSIPDDLANATSLAQLSVQEANFSGPFPNFLTSTKLIKLRKLSLSGNHLLGPIPDLSGLLSLTTLDLSHNNLNGSLPSFPTGLVALDLSHNQLSGQVPLELVSSLGTNFSFAGNLALCGSPTPNRCNNSSDSAQTPEPNPGGSPLDATQAFAPTPETPTTQSNQHRTSKAIVAVVFADTLGLLLIVLGFLVYLYKQHPYWRKRHEAQKDAGPKKAAAEGGVQSSVYTSEEAELVFVENAPHLKFDLEDLLRASAEFLGKGSLGMTYKACLDSGNMVAVKRLKAVKEMNKQQFQKRMGVLGRLRHPQLLPLRAYYYAKEEKLLVYDYINNGSLASALHGPKDVESHRPLDWDSRLKIAHDVGVGLMFLHEKCPSRMVPHQNLKSSNILLGNNYDAYVADFCQVILMPPKTAAEGVMTAYAAPELLYHRTRKQSQRSDVYSFGVLLLELLTGRKPAHSSDDDYGIDLPEFVKTAVREKSTAEVFDLQLRRASPGDVDAEMQTVFQIAMRCVEDNPDRRPPLSKVLAVLERMMNVRHQRQGKAYSDQHSGSLQTQSDTVVLDRAEVIDSQDFTGDSDASFSRL